MNRVTRKKNKDFTIISNVFLRDENLSLKAKGFLAVVMGLSDDWDFTINGICAILKEGKTAVYSTINELKDYGYCTVETCRNDKGMILGNDYTFYEKPYKICPHTEKPNMDNTPQLNTNNINDINNKEDKDKSLSKKEENDFVDMIYALYPTKCPKRNSSLGKSYADKKRILKLLKVYTREQIEKVVKYEIKTKYGISYMSNFSTFLNNFPDPNNIEDDKEINSISNAIQDGYKNDKGEIWSEQLNKWLK